MLWIVNLQLRDLQNDHVVRIIGVCIDEGHESIITLYCQKGSLQVGGDIVRSQCLMSAMFCDTSATAGL